MLSLLEEEVDKGVVRVPKSDIFCSVDDEVSKELVVVITDEVVEDCVVVEDDDSEDIVVDDAFIIDIELFDEGEDTDDDADVLIDSEF